MHGIQGSKVIFMSVYFFDDYLETLLHLQDLFNPDRLFLYVCVFNDAESARTMRHVIED
jgi:hypothetical protein